MTQKSKGNRIGENCTVRITPEQLARLHAAREQTPGPKGIGPWLLWRALDQAPPEISPLRPGDKGYQCPRCPTHGNAHSSDVAPVILDLCSGSGAWSEPYLKAGYQVVRVTLPAIDVRTFEPPPNVHGVLAAPPCTEFSIAKNAFPRDFSKGLECVTACLRIIATARPVWWALENPGRSLLARWLGPAKDTWEPFEFGDPWTKRTALWGNFTPAKRGPFVEPKGSAMRRSNAAARAVTPPNFARAFFEANP